MTIVVCGCSFSTRSEQAPGKHWSELLEKKLNRKIINLSQNGASNGLIRLQIEYAKNLNPDWIIATSTGVARIEIPYNTPTEKRINYNLKDFNGKFKNQSMISMTIAQLIDKNCPTDILFYEQKSKAAEEYFLYLYDKNWKRQIDQWLLTDVLKDIVELGINLSYDPYNLNLGINNPDPVEKAANDGLPQWFKDKYYIPYEFSYQYLSKTHTLETTQDPGYHLDNTSQELLSEYYYQKILHIDS